MKWKQQSETRTRTNARGKKEKVPGTWVTECGQGYVMNVAGKWEASIRGHATPLAYYPRTLANAKAAVELSLQKLEEAQS